MFYGCSPQLLSNLKYNVLVNYVTLAPHHNAHTTTVHTTKPTPKCSPVLLTREYRAHELMHCPVLVYILPYWWGILHCNLIFVLGCASASGERLPPYILYKGKNLYTSWTSGGPAGTLFGVSDSGWMERANFLDWFKKLFLPAIQHLTSTPDLYT